jgi:hypothetical protein
LASTTSTIPNIVNTNISSATLNLSTGITAGSAKITNATATNVSTAVLIASTGITTGTISASGLSALANVTATNASVGVLIATTSISSGSIQGTNSTITNAVHTTLSSGTINISTGVTTNILLATTSISSGSIQGTNIIGNSISAGTLSGTTITGGNLSLSGDLIIAGTLTTVNITSTNILNTNISIGTISATGLSSLANVTATNASVGGFNATGLSALANVTATNASIDVLIASTGITTASLLNTGLISTSNLSATTSTIPNAVFTNISTGTVNSSTGITTGSLEITSTNNAFSKTSGSVQLNGGMGVLKDIYCSTIYANVISPGGLPGVNYVGSLTTTSFGNTASNGNNSTGYFSSSSSVFYTINTHEYNIDPLSVYLLIMQTQAGMSGTGNGILDIKYTVRVNSTIPYSNDFGEQKYNISLNQNEIYAYQWITPVVTSIGSSILSVDVKFTTDTTNNKVKLQNITTSCIKIN